LNTNPDQQAFGRQGILMTLKWFARATCALLALGCFIGGSAFASGRFVPATDAIALVHKAQMQGLLDLFADDGDDYSNDRHYDFDQYRNSTSRKERIRDYYRVQKDVQKDYWKGQKEMQKNAIKRQRGW
jgi:hypothetical protein